MPSYANHGPKLQDKMRQQVDFFLKQGGIEEPTRRNLQQRVFVSFNDPIFNFRIDDRTPIEKLLDKGAPGTINNITNTLLKSPS